MQFFIAILLLILTPSAEASLGKWFRNEVKPTLAGKRPLKIDPKKISITSHGKPILKYEGDSLYIRAGSVKFKTSNLRQSIAEAGAIFAGDTTVISKVLADQFKQKLEQASKAGDIIVSETPPIENEASAAQENCTGKKVSLFNQTTSPIRYAMNAETFQIASGKGYQHCSNDGEFFLQFDDDISEVVHIARYYLTGKVYGLFTPEENNSIEIFKEN